jgi:hypothetical protein
VVGGSNQRKTNTKDKVMTNQSNINLISQRLSFDINVRFLVFVI